MNIEKKIITIAALALLLKIVVCNTLIAEERYPLVWSFNEDQKTDAAIHGATWCIGKRGRALQFDGKDDYVDCGKHPSLNITGKITIAAWIKVKPVQNRYATIVGKRKSGVKTVNYYFYLSNNKLRFGFADAAGKWFADSTANTKLHNNKWHHVAVTYDRSFCKFYVDGKSDGFCAATEPLPVNDVNLYIGYFAGGGASRYFKGAIDDVRLWNRALSSNEIKQIYNPDLIIADKNRTAKSADWPAYKCDAARSGVASSKLNFPLQKNWIYPPSQGPNPAWPEPGKELNRLDFDKAFHPVIAEGVVYFGSSADDTVRALDVKTGRLLWSYTTSGPVRFAPAFAKGKIYIASDDGHLYCLDAKKGRLIWKFRAAPNDDQIIGNGRMISRWPLRSGVLVDKGTVYLTAGMWPSMGVFVYALNAEDGKEIWCNDSSGNMFLEMPHPGAASFTGVTPQGYLLISNDVLLVPTGRSVPAAFDRKSGRLLFYRPDVSTIDGGTWVTAVNDIYFGPDKSSRDGAGSINMGEYQPDRRNGIRAYRLSDGSKYWRLDTYYRILIAENKIFAAGQKIIAAIDFASWEKTGRASTLWRTPSSRVYCFASSGNVLLAGGTDSLCAYETVKGKEL